MDSIIQQIIAMEATLKAWIGTDNCASFIEAAHNDTEHIPAYAQGASSAGFVAAGLLSIEAAANALRRHLNIPLTSVSRVTITSITLDPPSEEQ
jgi:hypothetical protein